MPTLKIKKNGKWEYAAIPGHTHKASDITDLNIDIPNVSDVYDETSSDAMSGKAVAEALETIVQAQPDWNQEDSAASDYIKNKPEIPSVDGLATKEYVDEQIALIDIPESGGTFEQVQADWDETDTASPAYIKNKPVISGDGGASVQANWVQTDETAADFIKNKPFGEYEGLVDILQPTTYDGFGLNSDYGVYAYSWYYTYDLIVGETYIVCWDGVDYTCVAQDAGALMSGAVAIGNLSNFGLSGNNEPFVISVVSGNGVMYASLTDTEAGNSHSVGIAQKNILVKKIDQKYLPNMSTSWNDLNDKPFYEYDDEVEILPLKTYENFALDSTYQSYMVGEESNYLLSVGESYKVLWDGIEYECIAQDTSSVMAGTVCIGNVAAWGFSGNDEPFIIMTLSTNNWSVYVSLTDTEDGGSHSVQIVQEKMLAKQIDKKFIPIPFFGKENSIILDGTFQDTKYDSDGDGIDDTWYGEAIIEDSSDSTLVVGETYTVVWNGVEHRCECIEAMGVQALGNTIIISGEDNGMPFAIARDVSGAITGAPCWIAMPIELEDDGIYHCTISGNSIKKVDLQYLYQPDWNEFDETSGGYIANKPFGSIPAGANIFRQVVTMGINISSDEEGGTIVGAAGNSPLKSQYIIDGVTYSVTIGDIVYKGVGSYDSSANKRIIMITTDSGDYIAKIVNNYYGYDGIFSNPAYLPNGSSYEVYVVLDEDIITKIDAKYLPDDIGGGSSLPEVNTSNNGQVMTVVNGAWTAQTPTHPVELPTVTTDDAGKFLRVGADGTWVAETIPNAEEASF